MFVAHVCERTNHSAKVFADRSDERAVTFTRQDRFQSRAHFVARRFVAEFTHERSKLRSVAQFRIPNC